MVGYEFIYISSILINMNNKVKKLEVIFVLRIILILSVMLSSVHAEIKLPTVISSNMVLQRDIPVNIWGWAKPGERISVLFNNQILYTEASADGTWKISLKPMQEGGPFDMKIKGENAISLKNILIGDVWICSGQSNMEMPLIEAKDGSKEVSEANHQKIRLFKVPKRVSERPMDNTVSTEWTECNQKTVAKFSATGYFFGRDLQCKINVPIGIIQTSWGGTLAESWTDMQTMYGFPEFKQSLEELKTKKFSVQSDIEKGLADWQCRINNEDIGTSESWFKPITNFTKWKEIKVPGIWNEQGLENLDGVVWFKTEFILTKEESRNEIKLNLGRIDDGDKTFVNGQLIGETLNQWDKIRYYKIPASVLVVGKNLLIVKVINSGGRGGILGSNDDIFLSIGNSKKSLAGNWKYKIGISLPRPSYSGCNPNTYPSLLYNAMINPLINYGIKGVIWYQGEANVRKAYEYRELLKSMINGWRKNWNQGDFPFLLVQLANFDSKGMPDDGDWAMLRESQTVVASSVVNCGMAVTIDIGESHNVHPRNKQDVGTRLALTALKVAYKEDIDILGPVYKSMTIENNKAIIEFAHADSGFVVSEYSWGEINGFEVAGSDKIFHQAKASIENNRIIVENDDVIQPIAVRYAWKNDPCTVDLYNNRGWPAAPFRTDNW